MSCDPKSVLGEELARRIDRWLFERRELYVREDSGNFPHPDEWHANDDEAADIVHSVAELFEIRLDEEVER